MRTLSRYFFKSYLRFYFIILLATMAVMIVVEMLVNFDEIVEHREEAGGILAYLFIRIPTLYLREAIPMTSFTAAFLALGIPARWREITAIKTGGISPLRIALPVLAAATLLSGLAFVANETFLLGATREFTRLEGPESPVTFSRGSFWYHRGNAFYNVRESHREQRRLEGVRVFRLDSDGRLERSIRAENVEISGEGKWRFLDARVRTFDPSAPETPPRFERLEETVIDLQGEGDLALLDASENTLSMFQLLEILRLRQNEGRDDLRYRAMLHARLAAPLTVLIFALLAIPIGISVDRTRSIAVSALFGIGIVLVFHAASRAGDLFAEQGFEWAVMAPWGVLAVFTAVGCALLSRVPR